MKEYDSDDYTCANCGEDVDSPHCRCTNNRVVNSKPHVCYDGRFISVSIDFVIVDKLSQKRPCQGILLDCDNGRLNFVDDDGTVFSAPSAVDQKWNPLGISHIEQVKC